MRAIALGVGLAALAGAALSQEAGAKIAIEDLLKAGWQIAGYTGADDSRSTFILFSSSHRNAPRPVQGRLRCHARAAGADELT